MSKYKLIQLTNQNIGAVEVDGYMPFGTITRRLDADKCDCATFNIANTNTNIVYLNEPGYYKVTYQANLVAGAVGDLTVSLIANNTSVYQTVETTAQGDTYSVSLPYVVRVCPNSCSNPSNCPMPIQLQLTGVAITDGTSNLIIEKVH